jgi:hypothetical protein
MPIESKAIVATSKADSRPKAHRSKATVGKALTAVGGDMRKAWSRRFFDILDAHLADLGGPDAVSEAELSIVRRASVLELELERLEAGFAQEAPAERTLDTYSRVSGQLRRLLETVGLSRRQKDTTLTLAQYVAQNYPAQDDEADIEE